MEDVVSIVSWGPILQGIRETNFTGGGIGTIPHLREEVDRYRRSGVHTAVLFAAKVEDGVRRIIIKFRHLPYTAAHLRSQLLPAAVEDRDDIQPIELGYCVQLSLEGVDVLGLLWATVAHREHRVIHDAMACVVHEDQGPLLSVHPVYGQIVAEASEVLSELFERQILQDLDVGQFRA